MKHKTSLLTKLGGMGFGLFLWAGVLALDYYFFEQEKRMTKNTKWWLLLTGVALLVALASGCCSNRVTIAVFPVPIDSLYGLTMCDVDDNPIILLSPRVMGTPEEKYTVIHEMVHVHQMRAMGCSKALMQRMTNPRFRFKMETQAHCVEFEQRVADGMDREWGMTYLLPQLQRFYAPTWSLQMIRDSIPCGGRHDPP